MVLEPVRCPDCGGEDVVKNGKSNEGFSTIFVSALRLSSPQLHPLTILTGVICLPSNNRLQIWQVMEVVSGIQHGC